MLMALDMLYLYVINDPGLGMYCTCCMYCICVSMLSCTALNGVLLLVLLVCYYWCTLIYGTTETAVCTLCTANGVLSAIVPVSVCFS